MACSFSAIDDSETGDDSGPEKLQSGPKILWRWTRLVGICLGAAMLIRIVAVRESAAQSSSRSNAQALVDQSLRMSSVGRMRIACVGASITAGYHSNHTPYSSVLHGLLERDHPGCCEVRNFGRIGRTVLKKSKPVGPYPGSYWQTPEFSQLTQWKPNIVVTQFASNDAKFENVEVAKRDYKRDYLEMIAHLQDLGAEVYIMDPPPVCSFARLGVNIHYANEVFPQWAKEIAMDAQLSQPIPVFQTFKKHCPFTGKVPSCTDVCTTDTCDWMFVDPKIGKLEGIHPSTKGQIMMGRIVYNSIRPLIGHLILHPDELRQM